MKITYFQVEQHLSKSLAPIYIVSGDELFLKQEVIKTISKKAREAGFNEHVRCRAQAGFDWDELHSLLYSRSLLAEKRLIDCDFREASPNKNAAKIFEEYSTKLSSDTLLLISIGKADSKVAKSAWYTSLEKIGVAIAIWPIPIEQLPQWIIARAQKYKLHMQRDAAILLAEYIEGNLVAAAQALEKIYLLKPEQAIDTALIEKVLTDESRYTIFDFVETFIASDSKRALHILESLKSDNIDPILILWAMTRELRLLADMTQQIHQGMSFEGLFTKYRIFARRQNAVRHFLTHFTTEDCWRYLDHAAKIDQMLKGAAPGNPWEALQIFCLR